MEETELEEGEACSYNNDNDDYDGSIDPDIALSYIDEKLQDVLGHFQKDFEGGVSAENLGSKFGAYGSFLPTYQQSPVWSHSRTPPKVQNNNVPRFHSKINDEKLQDVLGHFRKDFEDGASVESLGSKFGAYGSFLPTYQQLPVWPHSRTPPKVQNNNVPRSPNNMQSEGGHCNSTVSSNAPQPLRPGSASCVTSLPASTASSNYDSVKEEVSMPFSCTEENTSDNLSTQNNAAIYSALGLYVSPSSSHELDGMKLAPRKEHRSSGGKKKSKGSQSHGGETAEVPKDSLKVGSTSVPKSKKNTHADDYSSKRETEEKLQKDIAKAEDKYRKLFGDIVESEKEENRMSLLEMHSEDKPKDYEVVEKNTSAVNNASKERSSSKKIEKLLTPEACPKAENWVCCDKCQKWRPLPLVTNPNSLPEKWFCSMITWLPGMNRCSVGEEETTKAFMALYHAPVLESQNNLHVNPPGVISRVNLADVRHPDQNNENYGSRFLPHAGKRKHGLKDGSSATNKDGSAQLSNSMKKNIQASVRSGSLNDVSQSPVVSEQDFQQLSKSSDLPEEKHKYKHKEKHKVLDHNSDGGETKSSKMKSKRESDQESFGASKKLKAGGLNFADEDWTPDRGRAPGKVGPSLSDGLPTTSVGKDHISYSDHYSKDSKSDTEDRSQVSAKKLKDKVKVSSDDTAARKRKMKDGHEIESLPGTGNHLEGSRNFMEFSENDYRKEKKARVSKSEGKESSVSKGNSKGDKKGGHVKSKQQGQDLGSTLSQRSLDGMDSKRDSGPVQPSVAATSSSSKASGSRKNKASFHEAKGPPVESVSSSPMRISNSDKGTSARRNLSGKNESHDTEFLAVGSPRRCSYGEDDGGSDRSWTARKEKTTVAQHGSLKSSVLDIQDKNLSSGKAEVRIVPSPDCALSGYDEDLELFHKHANPTKDCMALSEKIVNYAKGNPLALKVLGLSLKGMSKQVWESALDSLQGIVNSKIFDVLKISYDGLNEEEKKLFLDLACFGDLYNYHGLLKEEFLDCLENSLSGLVAKSLITRHIRTGDIEMNDLLQEMGREIVCRESPNNPGKRSRLWERNDVIRTLEKNTGTDVVEVISLDMDGLVEDEDMDGLEVISLDMDGLEDEDIHLNSQVFDKMHNLRFLIFHSMYGSDKVLHLPNGLNCLPDELMFLHWLGYPLRALPLNFKPKKLVKLDLSGSNIEQLWEGTKCAPKLKWLNLSYCEHLTRIPNLSDFPLLVQVDLSHCESLVDFPSSVQQHNNLRNLNMSETAIGEVPSSIQSLTNLTELKLANCTRLKHISTNICKLKSLSTLDLTDCTKLKIFPEILETMESLKSLKLSAFLKINMDLKVLPTSIERLNGLRSLTLTGCKNLEMLPDSICNLTSLEDLYLSYCSKPIKLPVDLGNLKSLKHLTVRRSAVGQLPSSITCLKNLEGLDCSGCSLMKISEDIGCLSSLKKLELSENMFESLPKSIKQLSKLEFLSLSHCNMLRSLPVFPEGLECLEAMDCDQLCQVPDASEFVHCINTKSRYYHVDFLFTNSLNLVKAVSNVFEESLRIMQRTEKGSGKPPNEFSIYLPGNKIPEWFNNRSLKSSVNIKVHQNDLVKRKFMGFAICAVFGCDENHTRVRLTHGVGCVFETYYDHIKICNGNRIYRTHYGSDLPSIFIDSDHMLLGYCSFYSRNPIPAGDSDYVDISIEFKICDEGNQLKCCAVHPIYAEEPIEIIGATIQEIGETSGRRDLFDDNDEEVEPHPKRICIREI